MLPSLLFFPAPPGGLERLFDFFRFFLFATIGTVLGDASPAAPAAASTSPVELALVAELALIVKRAQTALSIR